MNELYAALIALAIAAVGVLMSYLKTKKLEIDSKALKERLTSIEDALKSEDYEYYIYCPECNSKIVLSKVKLYISNLKEKGDN